MRILLASDKYKGSLTATQVAATLRRVLEKEIPGVVCDVCPIADGGEGTTEAMITALGGEWVEVPTFDAQGRAVTARYGLISTGDALEAVMEMSAASGLAMVSDRPLDPTTASTYGTGVMMQDALERGAQKILIGIGGSATNDGGTGMAQALGFHFLDAAGKTLECVPRDLDQLASITTPPVRPIKVQVACDVNNPLLGPQGCTRVYGPQKGVNCFDFFEYRLGKLADGVKRQLGVDAAEVPGAGAAGGLGYGLIAFCGAELVSGFDLVADAVNLKQRIAAADLVITGEGRLDAQTLHGKGPVGVAQMARAMGRRVAAFAGAIDESPALRAHFDLAHAIKPAEMPLAEAIARAEELLEAAVRKAMPEIRALLG
ncbi:glycerate kinase [Brevifollis gellanilyticus]|uniref:Glycerate kinase n=1 Tax=Brevifollis gellanilyticus TaxID=748831 RepID=A0A512M8J8_9BACT|nr:glycerate kinase [Brevifollis gellanilyticus]GEP43023.1 glycerate kinase [Brevifollis gellanilyticus]